MNNLWRLRLESILFWSTGRLFTLTETKQARFREDP